MGLSKRLRFEIFKRDGFKCQYCGRGTPEVVLEVDHVIPVSDDGTNDSENLLTSCFDCNRGKGATPLDRPVVRTISPEETALLLEREEQLRAYNEAKREQRERLNADFDTAWNYWFEIWGNPETLSRWECPWESSLRRHIDRLGVEAVLEAMDSTRARFSYITAAAPKYFGGILKWKVAEAEGRVTTCIYCGKQVEIPVGGDRGQEWYHIACEPSGEAGQD